MGTSQYEGQVILPPNHSYGIIQAESHLEIINMGEIDLNRTKFLLQTSAIFAVIGTIMGSHMAGAGSMALRPIHAHILVVGWLSLFAFAAYYRMFPVPKSSKLATVHVWTAFFGSIGLSGGMWAYYFIPGSMVTLMAFIIGGTILAVSFILFAVMTFVHGKYITDAQ
ncbi:hypothetical protein [Thalassobacillus sp. C254]|uniref:hypothetical protein n=1 Tax=Thalassobacillus sp. C254 TaxID=1225341 RepID=UPI000AF41CFE|nr:hypothetical protein [Thalassobacillus sp. C254]